MSKVSEIYINNLYVASNGALIAQYSDGKNQSFVLSQGNLERIFNQAMELNDRRVSRDYAKVTNGLRNISNLACGCVFLKSMIEGNFFGGILPALLLKMGSMIFIEKALEVVTLDTPASTKSTLVNKRRKIAKNIMDVPASSIISLNDDEWSVSATCEPVMAKHGIYK